MKLSIRGILNDGSNPQPDDVLAVCSAQPLYMPMGGSLDVELSVYTASGAPLDLSDSTVTLRVRKSSYQLDGQPGFTKSNVIVTATSPENVTTFEVAYADTQYLEPGRYVYDVWIEQPSGVFNQLVALSSFTLMQATR